MTRFDSNCQPAACRATFTVDGQRGNQKYLVAGTATLQADEPEADGFLWEIASSPPGCDYLLAGATQPTARLSMPGSGAYVVRLTVRRGECTAQERAILWVATPRRLYRIPADGEALRFDGSEEWAGDLARVVQQVDWSLPTPEQKAALDAARRPGPDNPFATLVDVGGEPLPSVLTEDEIAAIKNAGEPAAENPFVTRAGLGAVPAGQLGPDQVAAIVNASSPSAANPFVTQQSLPSYADELTPDQKAAIQAAQEPGAYNPFVTQSALPAGPLTGDQVAAIAAAAGPSADNPFATCGDLAAAGNGLTEPQKAAIHAAHEPGADNPFITLNALPPHPDELTLDQRAAIAAAQEPGQANPFITRSALPTSPLTDTLLAALLGAQSPGPTNPFVTAGALPLVPPPQLTPDQVAAVDGASSPSAANPFVTQSDLVSHTDGLTAAQKAAIQAAQEPGGDNPFITRSALPPHADELTAAQVAAIAAAQEPGQDNPFITRDALPTAQLTAAQLAAVAAGLDPSGDNPFMTRSALPASLPAAQRAALAAAHEPGAANPFATQADLPLGVTAAQREALDGAQEPGAGNPFATRSELPPGLTAAQKEAMERANAPGADNAFATVADLVQAGQGGQVVAAGFLDLNVLAPQASMGSLRVVANDRGRGLATLSFAGYRPDQQHLYVVSALAAAQPTAARPQDVPVASLVGFEDRGFTLQMAQPAAGAFTLGRCMVQVTRVLVEAEEPVLTIEQAISRYFTLIQTRDFQGAWPMLSAAFRQARNLTFERYVQGWTSSGPAIVIALHRCSVTDTRATLGVDLNYPAEGDEVIRRFRFDFLRSPSEGHPSFGRWLFADGAKIELQGPFKLVWDRLAANERSRLGRINPCAFEISAKFAFQSYQHGLMFWFQQRGSLENIWVLYEPDAPYLQGSRWERYVDNWPEQEEISCDQARALGHLAPIRGFGWLWCNNAEVRQTLGTPREREAGSGDVPPFSRVVFYSGGVVFFKPKREGPMNAADEGIVLFNNGGWRRVLLPE